MSGVNMRFKRIPAGKRPYPIKSFLLAILLVTVFIACTQKLVSKKTVIDGREMLFGKISAEQLYFDYPDWQQGEKAYQPDKNLITKISGLPADFSVKIFLATWCPDSKREVPHFFKILKAAGLFGKVDVQMWAVNRKLKLADGLAAQHNIKRVPTFIFYRNGEEIGRIIESPQSFLLEEDVYQILSGAGE
ncbi:MAG TPA: thioredoxin [Caldithrix abyssi]|uniref:Thioredoxin n=1 Tax=Caldithrix abyssi TaxID=187145 RepID=A0A7V5PQF6_CALAY|nr:thioredoxin [Caldithrix abyssi]